MFVVWASSPNLMMLSTSLGTAVSPLPTCPQPGSLAGSLNHGVRNGSKLLGTTSAL